MLPCYVNQNYPLSYNIVLIKIATELNLAIITLLSFTFLLFQFPSIHPHDSIPDIPHQTLSLAAIFGFLLFLLFVSLNKTKQNSDNDSIVTYRNSSKLRRRPTATAGQDSLPYGGSGVGPDVSGSPTANGKLEKVGICIYLEDSADDDDTMMHSPQDENGGFIGGGMTGMTRSYTAASSSDLPPHVPVVPNNSTAVAGRSFVPLARAPSAPGSLK